MASILPTPRIATLLSLLVTAPLPAAVSQQASATIATTRTLMIDGDRHQFPDMSWVGQSGAGEVAVAFVRESRIQVFSASGEQITTLGRRDEGPGEFVSASPLGWAGARFLVSDRATPRITGFGAYWKLADTERWPELQFPALLASR